MTVLLSNPPSLLNIPTLKSKITQNQNQQPKIQIAAAAKLISNQQEETETQNYQSQRRCAVKAIVAVGCCVVLGNNGASAMAQSWGTRSKVWERFFGAELSPEESAERIKLTAQGLHTLREMLEHFSWKYVLYYIRDKKSFLSKDVKNAFVLVPQAQRSSYINAANDLVDNMSELDNYVRTPKIYESYLYYEKTLKSIDDLVANLD